MAPARTSTRRSQRKQDQLTQNSSFESAAAAAAKQLFVDPLIGTPLALFVEKDVDNRDAVVEAITVSRDMFPHTGSDHLAMDISLRYKCCDAVRKLINESLRRNMGALSLQAIVV